MGIVNLDRAKTLTLIIGAGASFDCAIPDSTYIKNPDLRPPLTKDLFHMKFNKFFSQLKKGSALAAELRSELQNGASIEALLKKVDSSTHRARKAQVQQIQLYFRALFGHITNGGYADAEQTAYSRLVHGINDAGFEKVLVINLNYDNLLERALSHALDIPLRNIGDYFNASDVWKILKPHGSVDWANEILHGNKMQGNHDAYLAYIDSIDKLETDPKIICTTNDYSFFYGGKPVYPRMVLPVENKYNLCCEDEQTKKAKEIISETDLFLIIGSSFKDQDIIDLITQTNKHQNRRTHYVGPLKPGETNADQDTETRLRSAFGDVTMWDMGFADFIRQGKLQECFESVLNFYKFHRFY